MFMLRVLPLALVFSLTLPRAWADGEALPPIFAESAFGARLVAPKGDATELVRPSLPLSHPVRAALRHRVVAGAGAAPRLDAPVTRVGQLDGNTVEMEPVVVLAPRVKKVEAVTMPGYLARAFTTGTLFEAAQPGGLVPSSIQWGLKPVEAKGYGGARDAPRVELSASWRR